MKKALALLILALTVMMANPLYSQEPVSSENVGSSYYGEVIKEAVGQELSVTLSTIDVTIAGKLIAVYEDGIIIETIFKEQIFVAKEAIAFIKFNKKKSKK